MKCSDGDCNIYKVFHFVIGLVIGVFLVQLSFPPRAVAYDQTLTKLMWYNSTSPPDYDACKAYVEKEIEEHGE